jgi:probable F420-dependent oxidoreductase
VRLGITAALTDLDVTPAALAAAIEEIGFDSFWLPEHTHLPVREDVPPALVEGVRLDDYKRCLDPLIALATAAAVTERIGLGTGILLAAQHDPIVLAKSVATLDHLSGGRVTLGVGVGWNRAEAEDHGVDFGRRWFVVREHLAAMEAIWSNEQAEFHGEFVDFGPTWSWPKPVQQPRVRTLIGGGARESVFAAVASYADGWLPIGGGGLAAALPRLRELAELAGRDPAPWTWSRSAPSPARASSSTTPGWAFLKLCCGSGLGRCPRCGPSSTGWRHSSRSRQHWSHHD